MTIIIIFFVISGFYVVCCIDFGFVVCLFLMVVCRKRLGVGMPHAKGAPSGGGQGMFHSVNVGPIHFAFVNSEV